MGGAPSAGTATVLSLLTRAAFPSTRSFGERPRVNSTPAKPGRLRFQFRGNWDRPESKPCGLSRSIPRTTPSPSNGKEKAKWSGYTTFRGGVILSDVLLVERPVTTTSKELGSSSGIERQYILLNFV